MADELRGLGTHLFVKYVPRPGDSKGTFSVFRDEKVPLISTGQCPPLAAQMWAPF